MEMKKNQAYTFFQLLSIGDPQSSSHFDLKKERVVIGSSKKSDICLNDPYISHYHAFIVQTQQGIKIVDLDSKNGVYVNDEKITSHFLQEGDCIRIGPYQFKLQEKESSKKNFKIKEHTLSDFDLNAHPDLNHLKENDEDFIFNEEHWKPCLSIPAIDQLVKFDYIDTNEESEQYNIVCDSKTQSLEVLFLSQGHIINVDYLPLNKGVFYASCQPKNRNTLYVPSLAKKAIPFIKIKDSSVEVYPLENYEFNDLKGNASLRDQGQGSYLLEQDNFFSFNYKTIQILIRLKQTPPTLRSTPFFGREKDFKKQSFKALSVVAGLFLLLFFIDTKEKIPVEKRKIAVIYKKLPPPPKEAEKKKEKAPQQTQKIASQPKKQTQSKKIKQRRKPKTKPSSKRISKKAPPRPPKKKARILPKKKVRVAQKRKKTPRIKKSRVKAYEFKMKKNLTSLFSKSRKLKTNKLKLSQTSKLPSLKTRTLSAQRTAFSQKSNYQNEKLGKKFNRNYDSSTNAKGLFNKSRVDAQYAKTKTVVMGSMNPELLRKILREYLPQFRHCYQKQLSQNKSFQGIATLQFRIFANGKAGKIRVKTRNPRQFNQQSSRCMAKVLRIINFPKPKGGGVVDVQQSLNFLLES